MYAYTDTHTSFMELCEKEEVMKWLNNWKCEELKPVQQLLMKSF